MTTRRYEYLPINQISIHPTIANHRELSLNKVTHLEKDILKNGLLEPLVVWGGKLVNISWWAGFIAWKP